MTEYRLTNTNVILRIADGAYIPPDPANRDYEAYLQWVAAGNTPDPAPPPSAEAAIADSAQSLLLNQARAAVARGDTTTALDLLLKHLGG
jgi:hypothetical protein